MDTELAQALERLGASYTAGLDLLEAKYSERFDALTAQLADAAIAGQRPGGQQRALTAEQVAFAAYLRRGDGIGDEHRASLTVSSDPGGGYLAPAELATEFIRNLVQFSPIRTIASVRTTAAPSVKYPKRNSVTNSQWEGETDDQPESTVTFGQAEVFIRQATTYVDISNQLLADTAGQAEAEVNLALAEDFGQKEGLAFVKGDGVKAPEGFMTNGSVGYTPSGNATDLSADNLLDLFYALPAAYRGRGTWVMNGTTIAKVRKLKDGNGQYLWAPGLTAGQPESILGKPVVEAVDMDDVGANAFPIAFGDFGTAYRVVDRLVLSTLVNPYILGTKGITRIHATRRVGGGVIQPAAIRKLKIAVS